MPSSVLTGEHESAFNQLMDESTEALALAKASPDVDDLGACLAVAVLKVSLAIHFVDQQHPGFAKDVEEKRQRVMKAMQDWH
jgi:hypothetical protein